MPHRKLLQITVSIEMADVLDAVAFNCNMAVPEYVRQTIANAIDYDLDEERANKIDKRGRPAKYKTDIERREAKTRQKRDQRKRAKDLEKTYKLAVQKGVI